MRKNPMVTSQKIAEEININLNPRKPLTLNYFKRGMVLKQLLRKELVIKT